MDTLFKFQSRWDIPADLISIWNHIGRVTHYPEWWPGVTNVELIKGPELPVTIGTSAHYEVRSPLYALRYKTEVVEVSTGKTILATSEGDLKGTGRWTFREHKAGVEAVFDWHVELTPPALRTLTKLPLARPIMGVFHKRVMQRGERGLKKLLRAEGKLQASPSVAV